MKHGDGITLSHFAALTGIGRAKIRNDIGMKQQPWDESGHVPEKNRRYTTHQAIALIVADSLAKQGLSKAEASAAVRAQASAIELFLDDVDGGELAQHRMIAAVKNAFWNPLTGTNWEMTLLVGTDTREELLRIIEADINQVGRPITVNGEYRVHVQGPFLACQSIKMVYHELRARAQKLDYILGGRLLKAPK